VALVLVPGAVAPAVGSFHGMPFLGGTRAVSGGAEKSRSASAWAATGGGLGGARRGCSLGTAARPAVDGRPRVLVLMGATREEWCAYLADRDGG